MSTVHRLAKRLLPGLAAAMEAESRAWLMRCPCGHERSVWEAGGLRFKAAGHPRRMLKCPGCGQFTWHRLFKRSSPSARQNSVAGSPRSA